MVEAMSDPVLSSRIKFILTVALLAIVTAFGVTFLRGEWRDAAAHDEAVRQAGEAEARGVEVPF
jgi:hypothetical protein